MRAKAEEKWEQARAIYSRARTAAQSASDASSEAVALIGMSEAELSLLHDQAAEQLARQGLVLSERLNDPALIVAALRAVSSVLYQRGAHLANQPLLERLLLLQQQRGDREGIAVAFNNLGNMWRILGDQLKAIDYLSRAEKTFAELGNQGSRAVVLNNIGFAYSSLGDDERSLEFSRKSLALAEGVKDDIRIGSAYNSIGITETYRGNYRESLLALQKSLDAQRRAKNIWSQAEVVNNIGLLYHAQQNHEQAIAYFKEALRLNRTVGDGSIIADAEKNLGDEMLGLNRLPEAAGYYRACLAICRKTGLVSLESEVLRGLAVVLSRQNAFAEADRELQRAVEIQRSLVDPPNLSETYLELARLRLRQTRPEEALAFARQSIEILASIERPEVLWQARLAAGLALERLHRNAEAAHEFEASIAAIESLRTRVTGPPTALPIYLADKLAPYQERVALALAGGRTGEALRFAEQSKSRALSDILRSGHKVLDKSLTPGERQSERAIEKRLAALDLRLAAQPGDSSLKSERDHARRELEALQTGLYTAHPEMAIQRGQSPAFDDAELELLARDTDAVLLDYFVTPQNSYVFVIRQGARPRVVALGAGQAALRLKAAEFHRQLSSNDLAYTASAQDLYRLLIAPLEADLAGAHSLLVLPDGPLWEVAFQALQPTGRKFLIERMNVSYAPSLAVLRETLRLARSRRAEPAKRELLALGNPAGQPPLPDAERQVREIEKLYGAGRSRVLVGAEATQARLRSDAGDYRVLHLASHAVLDPVNPMYSRALLARSGTDPGILEAREFMQYNLKAELLVLSACETARGQAPGGEGINGLLWAAFVAGAPTTVASLWRVESASTSELMISFHRNWLEARRTAQPFGKAASLRKAALRLIAGGKYAHPFYWAGMIVIGSPL